jgi:hypothetical protein
MWSRQTQQIDATPGSHAHEHDSQRSIDRQSAIQRIVWRQSQPRTATRSSLRGAVPIYGYIYDVKSGQLIEVEAATKAGATG